MSSSTFCFVQGRTRPYFAVQLFNELDDTTVDLTGATVVLNFRHKDDLTAAVSSGACVVTAAATGKLEYRWGASDLNKPGTYVAEFVITYADLTTQSVIIEDVLVREKLA